MYLTQWVKGSVRDREGGEADGEEDGGEGEGCVWAGAEVGVCWR